MEKKAERLALLDFKTNYRATVITPPGEGTRTAHIQRGQDRESRRRPRWHGESLRNNSGSAEQRGTRSSPRLALGHLDIHIEKTFTLT